MKNNYEPKRKTIFSADCKAQFHATFNNGKLGGKNTGLMAVGYLSGKNPTFADGTPTTDCRSTCHCVECGACDNGNCYAVRGETRFPNTRKNRIENTLQLRNDIMQHFSDMYWTIKDNNIKIVRYTESGEIESLDQFMHLYRLSMDLPAVKFYLYTKNYVVLREFFRNHVLPKNLVVLVSVWGDHGVKEWEEFKKYYNVKCFAVNSDLKVTCFCPAYRKDENGKTYRVNDDRVKCGNCKLCFDSTAKIIGCLEH